MSPGNLSKQEIVACAQCGMRNLSTNDKCNWCGKPLNGPIVPTSKERTYRQALEKIKARVCGEAFPHWENTPDTTFSRSYIADLCDMALSCDSSAVETEKERDYQDYSEVVLRVEVTSDTDEKVETFLKQLCDAILDAPAALGADVMVTIHRDDGSLPVFETTRQPSAQETKPEPIREGEYFTQMWSAGEAKCAIDKTCLEYPRCRCGSSGKASVEPAVLDRMVTVCDKCLCACCWHGEFMCDEAKSAGTVDKSIRDLLAIGEPRESNEYWFKSPANGKIDQAGLHALRAYLAEKGTQNGKGD